MARERGSYRDRAEGRRRYSWSKGSAGLAPIKDWRVVGLLWSILW